MTRPLASDALVERIAAAFHTLVRGWHFNPADEASAIAARGEAGWHDRNCERSGVFQVDMTRRARLFAALCSAVFFFGSVSAVAAAPVRERLIETVPSLDSVDGLTAGYGYVAWIDGRRTGARRVKVVRSDGKARHAWLPGRVTSLSLRRHTDLRTGLPVTRLVVVTGHPRDGTTVTTLRSPSTLRSLDTQWATLAPGAAVDGAASVSATVEPDPSTPADSSVSPPTRCLFSATAGLPAVPTLPDCAGAGLLLRGPVLTAYSGVPSGTSADREKGQVNQDALSMFSLQRPELGWRRLATFRETYDGGNGVQAYCVSERGIALLEGERRSLLDRPVATWTLRWVPADPSRSDTIAAVPQLDQVVNSDFAGSVRLACEGTSIYAEYVRPLHADRLSGTMRVVQLLLPR